MFDKAKQQWLHFRQQPAGERFRNYYAQRQAADRGPATRALLLAAAVLLMVIGLVMLVAPGPGLVACGLSAAIFAGESLAAARGLDRAELVLREWLEKWRARR